MEQIPQAIVDPNHGVLPSHLPCAAFLLHVFLDVVPDASFGEEVSASDLLKRLIAAISLQR